MMMMMMMMMMLGTGGGNVVIRDFELGFEIDRGTVVSFPLCTRAEVGTGRKIEEGETL